MEEKGLQFSKHIVLHCIKEPSATRYARIYSVVGLNIHLVEVNYESRKTYE